MKKELHKKLLELVKCNLNYIVIRFIPIYFHNISGYDVHIIVKEFGDDFNDIKIYILILLTKFRKKTHERCIKICKM